MNEIKVFQTGRHYSEKGQRIAYMVDDENIYFVDIDRGIDGRIPHCISNQENKFISQEFVLSNYDYGNYKDFYAPHGSEHDAIRKALRDKAMYF
jgi:hypothetical protein